MSKSPHTPEFRAMVSQEYLDGLGSYDFLASKYQISSKTLKQWVAKYRLYGIIAFQNKKGNATYSSDFKKMCVEAVLSGDGSVDDIVAKYNISSRVVLRNWILSYNANRELKGYDPKPEVYMAEARRKTTIEERKEIVKYCINHNRDYKETASSYDVSYSQVYSWVKKHDAKRVHRIMKKLNIHSVIRKKKKKYKSSTSEAVAENVLQRDFYATAPNQKWVTDVTEFKVPGEKKKLYLSAIIDLYDRYPVSHVISGRNDNRLVFKTFDKAIESNSDAKPIFHSDRGFQYTSKVFQQKIKVHKMEQSMSRVGHCIDNGPTEGFWGIIKAEMYQMYEITDEASLRYAINDYIRFYATERPQGRYHCQTPYEVRKAALSVEKPMEYPIPENKRIKKYKEKWCA